MRFLKNLWHATPLTEVLLLEAYLVFLSLLFDADACSHNNRPSYARLSYTESLRGISANVTPIMGRTGRTGILPKVTLAQAQ